MMQNECCFDCIYRLQLPGRVVAISNLKKDCAVRNKYADKRVTGIITTVGRRLLRRTKLWPTPACKHTSMLVAPSPPMSLLTHHAEGSQP